MKRISGLMIGIWCGLLAWAIWLALGAALYAPSIADGRPVADWRRAAILLSSIGLFLGTWLILVLRKR